MINAFLITNYSCNLNCCYCDVNKLTKQTLSTLELKNIIDTLKIYNCEQIDLIGGEPFLREDISELLSYIKSKEIKTVVHSNGKILKKNQIKDIDIFQTCINGTKETHEKIRGKNTYDITLDTIFKMKKNNVEVIVDMILTQYNTNEKEIEHVLNLAKKYNFKVNFQKVFEHKLVGIQSLQNIKSSQVEEFNAFHYILENYNHNINLNSIQYITEHTKQDEIKVEKCKNKTIIISPEGNIAKCFGEISQNNPNGLKLGWDIALNQCIDSIFDCHLCPYSNHAEENLK
jgi:MoaA/NifB/PqqE/SkfB family radical SAM enzyme